MRLTLRKPERDYLVELEDAVFVVKNPKRQVQLSQSINLTATGVLSGGFCGTLIGMIFLSPLLGRFRRRGFRRLERCRYRRPVHERAGRHDDIQPFRAIRPCP